MVNNERKEVWPEFGHAARVIIWQHARYIEPRRVPLVLTNRKREQGVVVCSTRPGPSINNRRCHGESFLLKVCFLERTSDLCNTCVC